MINFCQSLFEATKH